MSNATLPTGPTAPGPAPDDRALRLAAPAVFVFLWSTGFICARYGMPHAEPFTYLGYRFAMAAALMVGACFLFSVRWPRTPMAWVHAAVVGVLMHGVYLGGVFFAVRHGTSAGISGLIAGAQPLLTAALAGPLLGERLRPRAWFGLVLGFAGVVLVVWKQAGDTGGWVGLASCTAGLFGITLATLYQKRFGVGLDLRAGSAIQFTAAGIMMWVLALSTERLHVEWVTESILSMAWLVLALSVGATSLLLVLIRHGAASKIASLFYLVPPVTAMLAFVLFGETLTPAAIAGMAAAVAGVALVTKS